jgi:CRP-like cAMP-binding protein
MKAGSPQIRSTKRARLGLAGRQDGDATAHRAGGQTEPGGDVAIAPEKLSRRIEAVQPHPLAELLACPPETGNLLNGSAQCLDFDTGDTVFRQSGPCRGLYVVVSGHFLRKTERLEMRLTLGPARAGDLVELAAALGDGRHTYSLTAQTPGSVLLLPTEALNLAFQAHPPLRMQLLEELAREVSRAYSACCMCRAARAHRRGAGESLG